MRKKSGKGLSNALWSQFLWWFLIFGFGLLVWAGISDARDTYSFWRYGVEKSAHVVALDHTYRSRGGTTFYYAIELEGQRSIHGFPVRLPAGGDVSLLTLPNDADKVRLGNERSSAFEIYTNSVGSTVMAVLIIGMYVFMAVAGPGLLMIWIKCRKQIIKSM